MEEEMLILFPLGHSDLGWCLSHPWSLIGL